METFKMIDNSTDLGALAHRGHDFCPYAAVAKYPYKYIDKAYMQTVSANFFAGGLLCARGWNLYYIHTYGASSKPLILVPALEVEALIHDINKELGTSLKFPHPSREPGFVLNFDEKASPRPRYLGRVNEDISVEDMEFKIPGPDYKPAGEVEEVEDRSFEAFKTKIEAGIQASKNKTKSQKEKKKRERVSQKQGWCAQLKRTQCYLGIRPRRGQIAHKQSLTDPRLSWAEFMEAQKAYDLACCVNLPALNIIEPVPYDFSQSVVFVCIDIEVWEKDHSLVTEIGICTLDTEDLKSLPPGEDGKAWMTTIRPRHFRITEHQQLVNVEFVSGCADRFERDFGTSEFISIRDAPQMIASCFKPPFSADYKMQSHHSSAKTIARPTPDEAEPKRNIVLVGHDIMADIRFMRSIGYEVANLSNVLEAIDTADMFRALKQEQQPSSLGKVLLELGITGWNLHNAGNDATYTLQAMIAIAFAGLHDKEARQAAISSERARKLMSAAQEAQDRIKEEGVEWDIADVEEGDGGSPVAIEPGSHPRSNGRGDNSTSGAPPKMNAAARRAMEQQAVKRAQAKEEEKQTATGGGAKTWIGRGPTEAYKLGTSYFTRPTQTEQTRRMVPQAGTAKVGASSKPVMSIDDLSARMKANLAAMGTDEEAQGGVKLSADGS